MTRVRVDSFTLSLDGFGAGPDQELQNPLGVGGMDLHGWLRATRTHPPAPRALAPQLPPKKGTRHVS
jgi:hypothetical protein